MRKILHLASIVYTLLFGMDNPGANSVYGHYLLPNASFSKSSCYLHGKKFFKFFSSLSLQGRAALSWDSIYPPMWRHKVRVLLCPYAGNGCLSEREFARTSDYTSDTDFMGMVFEVGLENLGVGVRS